MDTMEITKIVGGLCGSLLVFLLISTAAHAIFDTHSENVAFLIETPDGGAGPETPEEEVDVEALVAAADAEAGASVFRRCAACHKVDGTDGVGPHLDGVVGRDIGSVGGFNYSGAVGALEGGWDNEKLFHFLANPRGYAPGTTMSFAGLPKPEDRANLIAYLDTLSN